MSKVTIFRTLSLLLVAVFVLVGVANPISAQQSTGTPQVGTQTAPDDSDELPMYINVIGFVQAVTPTTLTINGLTIIIPTGMALPDGVAVGKVVSLRGNLLNDDTIKILFIVAGYHLPTATPMPTATATAAATELGTVEPTAAATAAGTEEPASTSEAVGVVIAGCDKPGQKLGLVVSAAYNVAYSEVVRLHCLGHSFGTIARAYLLVVAGKDSGTSVTVDIVLMLRTKHNRWRMIIIMLNVRPDSTLIILIIDGGHASVFIDCGNHRSSTLCVQISGGSGGGGGKGGMGGMGDDD